MKTYYGNKTSSVSALSRFALSPEQLFWALACGIALLSILYISLIGATIRNVVERKNAERAMSDLSTRVSLLESEYLLLEETADLPGAMAIGYSEISDIAYVPRTRGFSMRDGNGGLE